LRERYRDHVQNNLQVVGNDFEREGLTEWDFDELPETYSIAQHGMTIRAYPALVDAGNSVSLKLYDNPDHALVDSLRGMVRFVVLSQKETVKYLQKQLFKGRELGLSLVDIGSKEQVVDDIICAAIKQVCFLDDEQTVTLIRHQSDFIAAINAGRGEIVERAELLADCLVAALNKLVSIKKTIKQAKNPLAIAYAVSDIQQQLQGLYYRGMVYDTPAKWLQQYPRYMQAIALRLDKVASQVNKDRALIAEFEPLKQRLADRYEKQGRAETLLHPQVQVYRWMLEELRISLFAQTIKTIMPVSAKRLNKQWELC
jgi:ATP-dependent helicase HrpA